MLEIRKATGSVTRCLRGEEEPAFRRGDPVRVFTRTPVAHYRVSICLRGKRVQGVLDSVIEPATGDNKEEGFGRNAGNRGQER